MLPPPPPASSPARRDVLRRTRRVGTAPEVALWAALDARGLVYEKDVPVEPLGRRRRPDVVVPAARLCVFVDGCFWHSCPLHLHRPQANAEWWRLKLADVQRRDRDTDFRLRVAGWASLRFWEHVDAVVAADRVLRTVRRRCPQAVGPSTAVGPAVPPVVESGHHRRQARTGGGP